MSQRQPLKALIIDDNAVNSQLAEAILLTYGVRVDNAADGETGLKMLWASNYDLVLLDISMPGMHGDQVCKTIRKDPMLHQTFVVAYTAHAFEAQKQRFLAAGFDDLLIKPISLESVRKVLKPVLSRAERRPRWDITQKLATLPS